MLIKIALILLVISTALFIITRVYFNTLSASNKFRLTCTTNYKTGEKILFMIIGFTYMITDDNVNEVGDFDELMRKQLRHEIIHAFLAESGLQSNYEHYKQFGHEETIVDWVAIQFPKMIKAFQSVNAI